MALLRSRPPRLLVLGDCLLDTYLHGRPGRPNPEAPAGQVFGVERVEDRPGGAAAVANIAAGLGAEVLLLGVTGIDDAGGRLGLALRQAGAPCDLVRHPCRVTPHKVRLVEAGRLRPDRIDREEPTAIPDRLADRLLERTRDCGPWDAVLVADYGKGTVTKRLLDGLEGAVGRARILIDPARGRSWEDYPPSALIKANLEEAREAEAMPHARDCTPVELVRALACRRPVVVTAGEDGIYWADGMTDGHEATQPRRVVDVAGAGDTVLAVLAIALAAEMSLGEACRLANRAAGIQVQRLGVARITPAELDGFDRALTPAYRRALRIGIDFDGTFTADRNLWRQFIQQALQLGHEVYVVSCRSDHAENVIAIQEALGEIGPRVPLILTGHRPKRAWAQTEGVPIDIWIDDRPGTIDAADEEEVARFEQGARSGEHGAGDREQGARSRERIAV